MIELFNNKLLISSVFGSTTSRHHQTRLMPCGWVSGVVDPTTADQIKTLLSFFRTLFIHIRRIYWISLIYSNLFININNFIFNAIQNLMFSPKCSFLCCVLM